MLGMEDMRVNEQFIRNSVRITNWNQMREEILEITRIQQYIGSQPMPMQLGANPKSKGKGKESKGKGKGKGKDKAKDVKKIVQESEKRRSEKVLLQQNRSRDGQVQTETERPCRGRRETGGSVATSTRHSSGCAVTVLTPRRETLVNVCHSHALCELCDGRNTTSETHCCDSTVAPVRLSTATDDPVHGDARKKSCFGLRDGRKFQV